MASASRFAAALKAGGEVVLAAGAVHSPQLLKLSGIGPREELERHGIDVVADLPAVGENLQVAPPAGFLKTVRQDRYRPCPRPPTLLGKPASAC